MGFELFEEMALTSSLRDLHGHYNDPGPMTVPKPCAAVPRKENPLGLTPVFEEDEFQRCEVPATENTMESLEHVKDCLEPCCDEIYLMAMPKQSSDQPLSEPVK